jgi:translation elongation factor EF-1beta
LNRVSRFLQGIILEFERDRNFGLQAIIVNILTKQGAEGRMPDRIQESLDADDSEPIVNTVIVE